MKKAIVRAEIVDNSGGVYNVRLFVPADSPDNLDGQVSIGWVVLNIESMKAYDVTNDPDNKRPLNINRDEYEAYVKKCISDFKKENTSTSQCNSSRESAKKSGALIPGSDSGRIVVGNGRLQFYSAPSYSCKMPGTFILKDESVVAYAIFSGFTSVAYLNGRKDGPVTGWVESNRLKPNGLVIAPHQR